MLEAAGEKVEEANNIDYDDYPYGIPQIGAALLIVAQVQACDMTSMVEKFLS